MRFQFLEFLLLFLLPRRVKQATHRRSERMSKVLKRLRVALLMVILVIFFGTVGYVWIENFDWFEAYYMTLITVSSVGFSELKPLSIEGRMFTTVLILVNLGIFAYSISTITSIFAEGGFTRLLNEFNMDRKIQALRNHTIICGFGRHALEVTLELSKQQLPFVVIDNAPEKLDALHETPYLFVEGDATHDDVLEEAGIRHAHTLVTTLPDDASNMFIVLSARQMNPELHIISRANNQADEIKIMRAGADHTVVPERIGGFYMATLVTKPDLMQFFNLLSNMGPSQVGFDEISAESLKPEFQNQPIGTSGLMHDSGISLVALRFSDGHYEFNPSPDTIMNARKRLVVLGNPDNLEKFRNRILDSLPAPAIPA